MILFHETIIQEPDSIICDRCDRVAQKVSNNFEFEEYLSIDYIGGYGSIIGDGTRIQLELCQYCIKELLLPYARLGEQ